MMDSKARKLILEVYGLGRMILGTGQIVGLTAGYFLVEFVVRYPPNSILYVIDQDVLALTYLAIFLRSLFHIVVGVGIARIRHWARVWLFFGWPIVGLITFGLVHTVLQDLVLDGFIKGAAEALSWGKLLLYLAVITFDMTFINLAIVAINKERTSDGQLQEGMEAKKISSVFFAAVLFFVVLLFLGRPIRQGFHQGYYKKSGKKVSSTRQLQAKRGVGAERLDKPESLKKKQDEKLAEELFDKPKVVSLIVEDQKRVGEVARTEKQKTAGSSEDKLRRTTPYRAMMGYVGGIFIATGLILTLLSVRGDQSSGQISGTSFVLLGVGFFLWIVYGFTSNVLPVALTSIAGRRS